MKKSNKKGWIVFIALIVVLGIGIVRFSGLKEFDLSQADVAQITFQSGNNTLAGSLILPPDFSDTPTNKNTPIAMIVQGSGAKDRFADSSYLPLIHHLLANGIGVFSWDKPGVGDSTGAWLQQSMQDRSDEVRAAYATLHSLPRLESHPIGLIGLSQAGWVLPITDNELQPAFSIIIGGAISWRRQQAYTLTHQLEAEGLSGMQIKQQVNAMLKDNDAAFGNPANANPSLRPRMNPDRFDFITRNYSSDATPYLATMQGPVLALWGEDDQRADPVYNQKIYQQHLQIKHNQQTAIIKNANHELFNAHWFGHLPSSEWSLWQRGAFYLLGHHAYAPRALSTISMWIEKHTISTPIKNEPISTH